MAGEIHQGGIPGGQPGPSQRTYSEEDVMVLMNEAAKRAASETMKSAMNANKRNEDNEDTDNSVINPKIVKQLKDTVAVFTALKELSSNPLQNTIEETVGTMAASVIQNAFAPRGPPPKKDLVDTILNSQFAYGLGNGLGARAPELVESMGRTFGPDRAGQMLNDVLGKYGGPGQGGGSSQSRLAAPNTAPISSPPSSPQEQKTDKQTEKELLLSLDPNNPEHVSAYAETQGGLPIEVARKMLMIHQDAFIEQMKKEGMNVDQISMQRGSHATPQQQPVVNPVQPISNQQHSTQQNAAVPNPQIVSQEIPVPTNIKTQSQQENEIDNIRYAEYQDIQHQHDNEIIQENQKMMKDFANDIGKIIGEVVNKIENLNNSVFTLQSELNILKSEQRIDTTPNIPPMVPTTDAPYNIPPMVPIHPTGVPSIQNNIQDGAPVVQPIKPEIFFDEKVQDLSDFMKELEEDKRIESIGLDNIGQLKDVKPSDISAPLMAKVNQSYDSINSYPINEDKSDDFNVNKEDIDKNTDKDDKEKDNKEIKKEKDDKIKNEKDNKEIKKFAHPINKASIKGITPSFIKKEGDNEENKKKENTDTSNENDEIKDINNDKET